MNTKLKFRLFLLSAIIVAVIVSVLTGSKKVIDIVLESKNHSTTKGFARLIEQNDKVRLTAEITGLSEGEHAIHIHEKADCTSTDGKSAGGHWNPTFNNHGKWKDPNGYHRGDIGNFIVGKDGVGKVDFSTDEWCIGCDDNTKNILGKAIIVHDGEDDFTSQPSGNAGKRMLCGAIIK